MARRTKILFLSVILLMATTLLAYSNSFNGPFIFDDVQITDNPQLHHLFPINDVIGQTNRPLLNLSLAINYHINGLDARGYHLFNFFVHLLAGLFLLGFLRRVFQSPAMVGRYGSRGDWLALVIAILWAAHPLQTNSVTYIIQRAEAMMGLFYLGTLYCAMRFFVTDSRPWIIGAVLFCGLGMMSKEVMVTAPLVVLLTENILWGSSWREIARKRKYFYTGLFLTWLIPLWLLTTSEEYKNSVGFGIKTVNTFEYAITQPGVILHYLKLAFIPTGLCLNYQWPVATTAGEIIAPLLVILGLIALTVFAYNARHALSFWGFWFFLILGVTSSFIPIQDLAFEHRMYLPLLSVIVLGTLGADWLLVKLVPSEKPRVVVAACLCVGMVGWLGTLTFLRNQDYRSAEVMWRDILRKRPVNLQAYNDLGLTLIHEGKFDEALIYLNKAIEINPRYIVPYNNIGLAYLNKGDTPRAIEFFTKAIRYKPDYAEAYNNLGLAYARRGDDRTAQRHYERAISVDPHYVEAYNNLGIIYLNERRLDAAQDLFDKAIHEKPHYPAAYNNRGIVEIYRGRFKVAEGYFRQALYLNPEYAKALNNLGVAVKNQGRVSEAKTYFLMALRLLPDYEEAQKNLKEVTD